MVNKVDILSSDQEVQEVSKFVAESATRMLGVDGNRVLPVSARSALDVKLQIGGGNMAGTFFLVLFLFPALVLHKGCLNLPIGSVEDF